MQSDPTSQPNPSSESDQSSDRQLFEELINIPRWLNEDREQPYPERLHRDREIAREFRENPEGTLAELRYWWHRVSKTGDDEQGRWLNRARLLVTLLLALLGALAGVSTSLALFHYTGLQPVNIVPLIAVFGALQPVLVLLSLILLFPGRLPGLRTLQSLLASFNPGVIAAAVMNNWVHRKGYAGGDYHWQPGSKGWLPRVARWQVLTWSHLTGASFNAAALISAMLLITFTDLAFGWSTTLKLTTEDFYQLTQQLSLIWGHWWPEASPSRELVEQSRYFRYAAQSESRISAQVLTGWWPFVLACMIFYGLLPRLLLLTVCSIGLHRIQKFELLQNPGVLALFARMNAPELSLLDTPESNPQPQSEIPPRRVSPRLPNQGKAVVILWSQAMNPEAVENFLHTHLAVEVAQILPAGGGQSLSQDEETLAQVVNSDASLVLFLARGWEPPVSEMLDFLRELDQQLASQTALLVLPLYDHGGKLSTEEDAMWRRALAPFSSRVSVEVAA